MPAHAGASTASGGGSPDPRFRGGDNGGNCHAPARGRPGRRVAAAPWTPAFAGVTNAEHLRTLRSFQLMQMRRAPMFPSALFTAGEVVLGLSLTVFVGALIASVSDRVRLGRR
jgi:hypothetical protein